MAETKKAASETESAPKTRRTRVHVALSDFGKLVHHHLIDNGMSMSDMEKAAGMSAATFRKVLIGGEKPPRSWIRNAKVEKFLRLAAADAHIEDIEADYLAILALRPPVQGETPEAAPPA